MLINIFPKKKAIKVDLNDKGIDALDKITDIVVEKYHDCDLYDKNEYSNFFSNNILRNLFNKLNSIYDDMKKYIEKHRNKRDIMWYITNQTDLGYSDDFDRVFYMWEDIDKQPRHSVGRRLEYFIKVIKKLSDKTKYIMGDDIDMIISFLNKMDGLLDNYKTLLEQTTVTFTLTIEGLRCEIQELLKDEKMIDRLEQALHCKVKLQEKDIIDEAIKALPPKKE